MKTIQFDFGFCHIWVRLGWTRRKPLEIRKYDIVAREMLPEIKRDLFRRLNSRRAALPLKIS